MRKEHSLFESEKVNVVKRFYHLDYFYYLIFLVGKGFNSFDKIFKGVIQNQNELSEISVSVSSREKFKTEYQIKSTIDESLKFDFISSTDKQHYDLTTDGNILLSFILTKKNLEAEKMLCQKMENQYGKPSQLVKQFFEINKRGKGLIVFPRPSPSALNFSPGDLINGDKLNEYCTACTEYAYKEVLSHMNLHINKVELCNRLIAMLSSYLERMEDKKQSINLPREVKKIMFSYYIDFFWPGKFDITSFDIWIRRAKELRLINFTEFFPGVNSLVIYPISILNEKEEINSKELIKMAKTKENLYLYRYEPIWNNNFKEIFVKSLWDNYVELSRSSNVFFIPVQDLRDIVCYKLQISEYSFAEFLGYAYNESMNEVIKQFKISLEVDRSPQERTFVNSKRYPILINNIPKNIIGIKMN